MKQILLFLSLALAILTLSSCQSAEKNSRLPASTKPRHIIISVHGIAGKENTFGSLLPALKEHLNEVDQGYEVVTANFVYATGSDEATLSVFKGEFTLFMRDLFKDAPITDNDIISFVTHSQGGLITTFWYTESLEAGGIDRQLASRVRDIITESTPFWGSKAAYLAYDKVKFAGIRKMIQKYIRMSPGELKELSFGSDTIYKFFLANHDSLFSADFESRPALRMLNLSGVFPSWDNPFTQRMMDQHFPNVSKKQYELIRRELSTIFNTGTRWESDTVVNNSSARIGFLYVVDLGNYKAGQVTPVSRFSKSSFLGQEVPYQLIETVHASPEPLRMMDIAYVPERCLEKDQCDHPSYKTIFKHVAACDRENSTCDMTAYQQSLDILFHGDTSYGMNEHNLLMSQMQTFSIVLNLRLPKGFNVTRPMLNNDDVDEYIKPGYQNHQSRILTVLNESHDGLVAPLTKDQIYSVYLGRRGEPYSRVVKHFPETNHLRFQFTGKVLPSESRAYSVDSYKKMGESGYLVRINVTLPGLKSRIVEVPVKPTFTSFVDIELMK